MAHSNSGMRGSLKYAGLLAAVGIVMAGGMLPARAVEGPSLGAARSFAILGASTVESTGLTSITGDVGVSPGTVITGFPPGVVSDGALHAGDATAATAHSDAAIAYAFLAGMATIPANELTGVDLGGKTLQPGVYYFTTSAQLTGTLTLDAMGDSAAVFVFKIGSTLTTASGSFVKVINGGADYDESKVFWQVGSSATLGSGTAFTGNILAYASITITSGSSMKGNALAMVGKVTLDANVVTSPALVAPGPAIIAPTNLTAVLNGSPVVPDADLSWKDASTNETEFRVYRREGAGPAWVQIATVASTSTAGTGGVKTYTDTGLDRMKIYTYRVTAFATPVGESLPSNEALVDTGIFLPINLTAVLDGSPILPAADLSWNDASDNETEFRVYRRDGAGPDWVRIATVPSTTSAGIGGVKTYSDSGLDRMMIYTYRVTAFGAAVGESLPSNEALVDTGVYLPINLTAVLNGSPVSPTADLSWNDASDNETEFRVYRRDGAGPDWVRIATVPSTTSAGIGGVKTYSDSGLDRMMIYTYRVTAFGAAVGESLPSNEALVDTGLYVPIVLTAVLSGPSSSPGSDLAWTDVNDDETEFRVYRRDGDSPDFVLVGTVPSTDTAGTGGEVTFHDPVLDPLTTFTYRVAAYSPAGGESAYSNEVLVSTSYGPAVRWLDVHLGRSRSVIRNRPRERADRIFLRGSYVVIDVDSEVPSVLPTDAEDPRSNGIAIQIRAPGNMFLLTIPADDAGWKVSKKGVYRWKSAAGSGSPVSRFRLDTRKSEFQLNARKLDFPSIPVNDIIVSLTSYGATGSDARVWEVRLKQPKGSGQRFTLPK